MMASAYDDKELQNLLLLTEVRSWRSDGYVTSAQLENISASYPSTLYHPNVLIRVLLFIASFIGISGVTGLAFIAAEDEVTFIVLGLILVAALEAFFIRRLKHYKSGVNEAILYSAIGYIGFGLVELFDPGDVAAYAIFLALFALSAYRYLDVVSTLSALICLGFILFNVLHDGGTMGRQMIPFLFFVGFSVLYAVTKRLRKTHIDSVWDSCLVATEGFCLLAIYASVNYFVVRELSVELLPAALDSSGEIHFAWAFYGFTVLIPLLYLWRGLATRDIVMMRIGLVVLAFSAFTFKYYFSTGRHEVTFTAAGAVMVVIALLLFRYLRKPRSGYTRENLVREKWASANPEAFVVSQTLGGNQVTSDDGFRGGGGGFSGGGASGNY